MTKVDLKKTIPSYAARKGQIAEIEVPPMAYLMLDGHGDPNTSQEFAEALQALYPVAYKTKFASKRELDRDYVVPPLEATWSADDMAAFTSARDKSQWDWTVMLLLPDWVEESLVEAGREEVGRKDPPARLSDVRIERLHEGLAVQTLHVGPFDAEAAVLQEVHDSYIASHGLTMAGRHHEIYLSDLRKTAPERQRTILRQPVRRA